MMYCSNDMKIVWCWINFGTSLVIRFCQNWNDNYLCSISCFLSVSNFIHIFNFLISLLPNFLISSLLCFAIVYLLLLFIPKLCSLPLVNEFDCIPLWIGIGVIRNCELTFSSFCIGICNWWWRWLNPFHSLNIISFSFSLITSVSFTFPLWHPVFFHYDLQLLLPWLGIFYHISLSSFSWLCIILI